MRYLKYVLIVLLALLIGRELVAYYQWFVVEGKTLADFKKLTRQEIISEFKGELTNPRAHYANAIGRRSVVE